MVVRIAKKVKCIFPDTLLLAEGIETLLDLLDFLIAAFS